MDAFTLLFLYLIVGLIAMAIYIGKGRSALVGFAGGLLLGPFGIILALVSSSNKVNLAKRNRKEEEMLVSRGQAKKLSLLR